MIDIAETLEFLDLFQFKEKGKIENKYQAVLYLDREVFSPEGEYLGRLSAVLPNKVEIYPPEGDPYLIDYPVYFGVVKNGG